MLEIKHLSYQVENAGEELGILNDVSLSIGENKLVVNVFDYDALLNLLGSEYRKLSSLLKMNHLTIFIENFLNPLPYVLSTGKREYAGEIVFLSNRNHGLTAEIPADIMLFLYGIHL